jgi:hypothetical protein
VIGEQLANATMLVSSEGFSAYGEGVFRWRYKVTGDVSKIRSLCGVQDLSICRFTRTKNLKDGVILTVTYEKEILTVEETWE